MKKSIILSALLTLVFSCALALTIPSPQEVREKSKKNNVIPELKNKIPKKQQNNPPKDSDTDNPQDSLINKPDSVQTDPMDDFFKESSLQDAVQTAKSKEQRLNELVAERDELLKEIAVEDKKRNRKDSDDLDFQERKNDEQDYKCLQLRSKYESINLEIQELTR